MDKTLYQIRKELKRLKEQGLIESVRYCEVGEDRNYLVSGYQITDKAKDTPEYKKAWEEEREICKKAFGIDIGGVDDERKAD
jgi:DNA-binding PadR family transcriptional regulator